MVKKNDLIITPKTKVGELLDTYPQLEEVLIGLSPAFEKLKNPILRRTVAKVASLQQIAGIGNLKVDFVVNVIRKAVGHDVGSFSDQESEHLVSELPHWLEDRKIVARFDATSMIIKGENPMPQILKFSGELNSGQIFELTTPFVPAPILDVLTSKGFKACTIKSGEQFKSYALK